MKAASLTPLALHGGKPVRATLLPYGRQCLTEDDLARVTEVLRSDWITTGPKVGEFEAGCVNALGCKHAVAISSGTAALHAAAFAAGLKPGDEAITTPLTFCATSNAVLYTGATPVFADIRSDTMTIDPDEVAKKITPRTRAIFAVDFAGNPAPYDELFALAKQHNLTIVGDAAHSLGAEYHGRLVGSIADLTTFSFHPVKHLTTGEGGLISTGSDDLARRLRVFRAHGITTDARERNAKGQWSYDMVELGYNYRISDFACALGLSQLARLPENLAVRRRVVARYRAGFAGMEELILPVEESNSRSAWHLYPIRLNLALLKGTRDEIYAALRAENIGVAVHYMPVPALAYYQRRFAIPPSAYPRAHAAFLGLLSLPMFHAMTDRDTDDVIEAMKKVLAHYHA